MTKTELEKIINDAEKYDHEATLSQIRYNLHSSIIEFIDEFGIRNFLTELNSTLENKGIEAELNLLNKRDK